MKLRVLALIAGCTLSLAAFATVHAPCKSGQQPAQKGSAACAPAPVSSAKTKTKTTATAKAPIKAKAIAKTTAKSRSAVPSKAKATTKAKTRTPMGNRGKAISAATTAAAASTTTAQAAAELPASMAIVDCDSTQTFLQGGSAQCPVSVAPNGSGVATQPRANPGTSCFAALAASHSSRRLAAQVPFLSASAASPEALANRGVPNRAEKEELGSVIAGYGMCLDMAASWRREAYAPAVVSALDAFWHEAQAILKELASSKRTFGEAARAIADTDKAYKARIGTLERVAKLQEPNSAH
jgi:hypothetical protein